MPTTVNEFPTVASNILDEVLVGATYAGRYNVNEAEFINGRQISVPEYDFGENPEPVDYNRFASDGNVAVKRTVFAPYIDKDFFKKVVASAGGSGIVAVTVDNIKSEIRKARSQFAKAGLSGGDLFLSSDAVGALENITNRQWSNETAFTDSIGSYDGFNIFEVDAETLGGNMLAISGGTRTVRYIVKRAASYQFLPGQHTQGDGTLNQFRWVFGTIALKNKVKGIYVNKA